MEEQRQDAWQMNFVSPDLREKKPRDKGLTMIIDKGLGVNALQDMLDIGSEYIDFIKFSFGTSVVYPARVLREKIKIIRQNNIDVYPGGTLFETAVYEGKLVNFLYRIQEFGFTAVEISDGTIEIGEKLRRRAIMKAHSLGLQVLTEVGKKDKKITLSPEEVIYQIKSDISNGASRVIIEGRESGTGGSLYNYKGEMEKIFFNVLVDSLKGNIDRLIWEAPLKKQQVILINELGSNVSMGNINPEEVIALEALRCGLRGDTFFNVRKSTD